MFFLLALLASGFTQSLSSLHGCFYYKQPLLLDWHTLYRRKNCECWCIILIYVQHNASLKQLEGRRQKVSPRCRLKLQNWLYFQLKLSFVEVHLIIYAPNLLLPAVEMGCYCLPLQFLLGVFTKETFCFKGIDRIIRSQMLSGYSLFV